MKRKVTRIALICFAMITMAVSLSSCYIDTDDDWWGAPPYGYTFNDNRLNGYWQLVQYNSDPVGFGDTNYLYFNGNGWGRYYYLENGDRYVEQLRYWCQDAVGGASNYQINIQYEYSSPVTESYWFTHGNNTLWIQWITDGGRVQTYVYDRIGGAPW